MGRNDHNGQNEFAWSKRPNDGRWHPFAWGKGSFQGGIDEVCVFNRVLGPAEVQALAER